MDLKAKIGSVAASLMGAGQYAAQYSTTDVSPVVIDIIVGFAVAIVGLVGILGLFWALSVGKRQLAGLGIGFKR
jgi:hypothetical protein